MLGVKLNDDNKSGSATLAVHKNIVGSSSRVQENKSELIWRWHATLEGHQFTISNNRALTWQQYCRLRSATPRGGQHLVGPSRLWRGNKFATWAPPYLAACSGYCRQENISVATLSENAMWGWSRPLNSPIGKRQHSQAHITPIYFCLLNICWSIHQKKKIYICWSW